MDMSKIAFIDVMRVMLIEQEEKHGPLNLLLSRNTEETSRAIDKILDVIIDHFKNTLKNVFEMYNIKIFGENINFKTKHALPMSAKCYNYLFLNTNFFSRHLLKKDLKLAGFMVDTWPILSPYLFLQIIWQSKCEDLLVESLMHIPLDLCVEILNIIIKHIKHEIEFELSRVRRHIFLLIYKIYCRCLWLHLGTLSVQNVIKCTSQLVICFQKLLDLLVSPKFVASRALFAKERFRQHGILVKNMLHYIRKCMHSKIESFSDSHNLAKLFTLTYDHFNENKNYHKLPIGKVKSIVLKLEKKLAILLLNQIKQIDYSEYMSWECIRDDENTTLSLQYTIVMECCHFTTFMKQNKFLVTNKYLSQCLEQLRHHIIIPRKSTSTLSNLCQDIIAGKLYSTKELMKRYKEWDLSVLKFLDKNIELLKTCDVLVILEYLHYKFPYLHTNAEKYKFYLSVLKILIQLQVKDMNSIVKSYVERHFDDNPLECLYDRESFKKLIESEEIPSYGEERNFDNEIQRFRSFLIFILLNPKEVLSKFVMDEIHEELMETFIFQSNMILLQEYYTLNKGHYSILLYILKDIMFQRDVRISGKLFLTFLDNAVEHKMIEVDDIINELYIVYLVNGLFHVDITYFILLHMINIFEKKLTYRVDIILLMKVLIKTTSLLRRYVSFWKVPVGELIQMVNRILSCLRALYKWEEKRLIHKHINYYEIEPLELNKLWPTISTLCIIREYERRCFSVHRRLRTSPQCHPKLRSYMQSFNLNQEAFIRHIILHHSDYQEYERYMFDLTFTFFHHFGWINQIEAYENIMRMVAEASQISLKYVETFPIDTFGLLLLRIVQFYMIVESNMLDSYDVIRSILLKTLSSMNATICNTPTANMYSFSLNHIQNLDLCLPREVYFDKIFRLLSTYSDERASQIGLPPEARINNRSSNHNNHDPLIEEKIASMYNEYLFVCECIKLCQVEIPNYSERLMYKLCLE